MARQGDAENLDRFLPTDAIHKGYGLTWYPPEGRVDPVILFRRKAEVYRWEYNPSLEEIREKVKDIDKEEGRG